MKSFKYLLGLAAVILCQAAVYAGENRLSTPDVTMGKGETLELPFSLDNTDRVVALQFLLTLPDGFTLAAESAVWSERAGGHEMTVVRTGGNTYKFLAYDDNNTAFAGKDGLLFSIQVKATQSVAEGSVHQPVVENLILSIRNGDNVATGMSIGKITIAQSPDLAVGEATADKNRFVPQDEVAFSWVIRNEGGQPRLSGWTENIYLIDSENREILVGSFQYQPGADPLEPGASVSRQEKAVLPQYLKIGDAARIKIVVIPYADSGEPDADMENNTYISPSSIPVAKRLYLTGKSTMYEGKSSIYTWRLGRSGATDKSQTFTLTADNDRLNVTSVTIPKGSSSEQFFPKVVDNETYEGEVTAKLTALGDSHGYEDAWAYIRIIDDDKIRLSITSDRERIEPGQTAVFTITADHPVPEKSAVYLSSDHVGLFQFPSVVYLEAGQTQIPFNVVATDGEIFADDVSVTFTARGGEFVSASVVIIRLRTPLPDLRLELTPDKVSEDAGTNAVTAVLKRSGKTDNKVTIRLSDNSGNGVSYSKRSVTMNPGDDEVTLTLGPVDNAIVDNDRIVTITAAVSIPNGVATGENGGVATADLTIYDNDGAALSLTPSKWVVLEGDEEGVSLTIKRNAGIDNPLVVTISCDKAEGLTFDSKVTVPAGEESAVFNVKAADNDVPEDDRTVTFVAQAEGYASTAISLLVSDRTLPDICVSRLVADPEEITATVDPLTLTFDIANHGKADLPAGRNIKIYQNGVLKETLQTEAAIAPGGSVTKTYSFASVEETGQLKFEVKIPSDQFALPELSYNNNSKSVVVRSLPPFAATLQTDKTRYLSGETMHITGHIEGVKTKSQKVEFYAINRNYRSKKEVTTDEYGNFSLDYTPANGQYGHFALGACYPGEGSKEELAGVDVAGMAVKSAPECMITQDVPYTGAIRMVNYSSLPLTGFNVQALQLPEGVQLVFEPLSEISGGANFKVPFTLTCSELSEGNEWMEIPLQISACGDLSVDTTIYYYCQSKKGKLIANPDRIVTTVPQQGADYIFAILNTGKGETGEITLALPPYITALTNMPMPSLKSEESAQISLHISVTDDMQFNAAMKGQIGINCANGEGLPVPFIITPVTDVEGTLIVDVCDEATYYSPGGPHVQDAEVVMVNPVTNKEVARGFTGTDGKWTARVPGGRYTVYVSAPKHNSKKVDIYVQPDTETETTVNITFSNVTVEFSVEETEIQDEYEIVNTFVFETQVMAPAVILTLPKNGKYKPGCMAVGQSLVFEAKLKNEGLITAENVQLLLENYSEYWYHDAETSVDEEFVFEALAYRGTFDLRPQQEVTVPICVTRTRSDGTIHLSPRKNNGGKTKLFPTYTRIGVRYEWYLGEEATSHEYYLKFDMGFRQCRTDIPSDSFCDDCHSSSSGGSGSSSSHTHKPNPFEPPSWGMTSDCPSCGLNVPDDVLDVAITLQFKSKLAMTRQAFRGTLTVTNGDETSPMTDVRLALRIVNTVTGDEATSHEFQTSLESLDGFTGTAELGEAWTLEQKKTGVGTILFIPTKYAAPTTETDYSFGGTLTYIDPTTGDPVTRELTPQMLTVSPTPDLELAFFVPREIIADDPMTPGVVEEAQEAEFALLVSNTGYGSAKNLTLTVQQPKIINSNVHGFPIEFSFKSCKQDGEPVNFNHSEGTLTNNFGTIEPQTYRYAQWYLTSTYKGTISGFQSELTHLTSHDNPDLSLISSITTHTMVHGVDLPAASSMRSGWLVDDLVDDNNTPDYLYRSNGSCVAVSMTSSARLVSAGYAPGKKSHNDRLSAPAQDPSGYILEIEASDNGWIYGNVADPTEGTMRINRIVRVSDEEEISLYNFWQTQDVEKEPFDYKIHFVDSIASVSESYVLYFEGKPGVPLDIESVEGLPAVGQPVDTFVTKFFITFNKPVQAGTFTSEDIKVTRQGKELDASQTVVTQLTDERFEIDIHSVSNVNGMYSFSVNLSEIYDTDGFPGDNISERVYSWSQYWDGKVQIQYATSPTNAGQISYIGESQTFYGSELKIQAVPEAGYVFDRWECDGISVSTNPVYTFYAMGDMNITACFRLEEYEVTVGVNDASMGYVSDVINGLYTYGATLLFNAIAREGYRFVQWSDGSTDNPRNVTVTQDMTFTAVFEPVAACEDIETTDGTTIDDTDLPYTWEGLVFTEAGTQTTTLKKADGCDSVVTFTLRVRYPDIVLQENESGEYYSFFAEDFNGRTVATATLNRQFTQGRWATLCLPFNVSKGQMMALGLNSRVYEFRYAETEGSMITIHFAAAQSIEAGKGYIVNANARLAKKESFVFPNVTINTDADNADITALTGYNDGSGKGSLYLVGTLRTGLLMGSASGNTYLGMKNNMIYYANMTTGTSIRAYRGFFRSETPLNAQRVRIVADGEDRGELRIENEELIIDDSSAVKFIDNGVLYIRTNGKTYNAQGQILIDN